MKTLKFSALAQNALNEREMNALAGGNVCGCACRSNSTMDNGTANHAGNLSSKGSMTEMVYFLDPVIVTPYVLLTMRVRQQFCEGLPNPSQNEAL